MRGTCDPGATALSLPAFQHKKIAKNLIFAIYVVGKTGFEPATPWSQTRCATGLRYFPLCPP